MQTDNNTHLELIRLWQEKTQAFFSDPKTIELMMQNMLMTQSFFQKTQEMKHDHAKQPNTKTSNGMDNASDSIAILNMRITDLEQRVSQLEGSTPCIK